MIFLTKSGEFNIDKYKQEESMKFANRQPKGFKLINFLGRVTISIVWLCEHKESQC